MNDILVVSVERAEQFLEFIKSDESYISGIKSDIESKIRVTRNRFLLYPSDLNISSLFSTPLYVKSGMNMLKNGIITLDDISFCNKLKRSHTTHFKNVIVALDFIISEICNSSTHLLMNYTNFDKFNKQTIPDSWGHDSIKNFYPITNNFEDFIYWRFAKESSWRPSDIDKQYCKLYTVHKIITEIHPEIIVTAKILNS